MHEQRQAHSDLKRKKGVRKEKSVCGAGEAHLQTHAGRGRHLERVLTESKNTGWEGKEERAVHSLQRKQKTAMYV